MKRPLIIFSILVIVGLGGFGIYKLNSQNSTAEKPQKSKPLPLVEVEAAKIMAISETVEVTASAEATTIARLVSAVEGPVRSFNIREGDKVRKNRTIATIGRNSAVMARLAAAREILKKENDELKRVEQLVEAGAIPAEELDKAQANYKSAKAVLAKEKENIRDYRIVAPWNGVVSKVFVAEGDYVVARTTLAEIYDPDSLVLRFSLPEAQSQKIKVGMRIETLLDAFPGKIFEASVSRVYPELDRKTRTRTIEAKLIDKIDLLPGMFARLKIKMETVESAIAIPVEAVLVTPKGEKVTFIIKDGKSVRRVIKTGIEEGRWIQILEGIQPGELVVVAGNEKLKDGLEIRLPKASIGKQPKKQEAGSAQ